MLMELLKRFIFNKVIFPDDDLAALLEPKVEVAGPEDAVELVGYVEVLGPPDGQLLHGVFEHGIAFIIVEHRVKILIL